MHGIGFRAQLSVHTLCSTLPGRYVFQSKCAKAAETEITLTPLTDAWSMAKRCPRGSRCLATCSSSRQLADSSPDNVEILFPLKCLIRGGYIFPLNVKLTAIRFFVRALGSTPVLLLQSYHLRQMFAEKRKAYVTQAAPNLREH